jgi:hypothetical protein
MDHLPEDTFLDVLIDDGKDEDPELVARDKEVDPLSAIDGVPV